MLVTAMLILPPLTALELSISFRMTIIISAIFAILSVIFGIIVSFLLNLPAGGTIVMINVIFLLLINGIKKCYRHRGKTQWPEFNITSAGPLFFFYWRG